MSYDVPNRTAILVPDDDLDLNTAYNVTIDSSVEDIDGSSPFVSDFVWSFSTSPGMSLVSKNSEGVAGDNDSVSADIDATGRYIVFESTATNLLSDVTIAGTMQVYRKDTVTGEVVLVSSDASGIVEADTGAGVPSMSSNGRYIVFESAATNLAAGSNGNSQIYLKDLFNGDIELVSRNVSGVTDNGTGASNAKVSDDGRYITFESTATNLVSIASGGVSQIYRKDMSDESVEMISRNAADEAGDAASTNADMSADGEHIVFESVATNLNSPASGFKDIYYVDAGSLTHAVETVSVTTAGLDADGGSNKPSVSDDGSVVVFHSNATNLDVLDATNGVVDVFMRDRATPSTQLVSATIAGAGGDSVSSNAHLSGNGIYVVFESLASDLVADDTNGSKDIFVRDLSAVDVNSDPVVDIERVNIPYSSLEAVSPALQPVISADGRYTGFHSIEQYTIDDTTTFNDVFRAYNSTYE